MKKIMPLTQNRDFKRLYHRGKHQVHPLLVTYGMKNRTGFHRVGITTSKKIGNAVERNRARRIIRAAWREAAASLELPQGWDFVFVARSKTPAAKSTQLVPIMRKHIETLMHPSGSDAGQKKEP